LARVITHDRRAKRPVASDPPDALIGLDLIRRVGVVREDAQRTGLQNAARVQHILEVGLLLPPLDGRDIDTRSVGGLLLRATIAADSSGNGLQFLRDLTLTDKTKIFKTSLLRLEQAGDTVSMYGLVSDDQRGPRRGRRSRHLLPVDLSRLPAENEPRKGDARPRACRRGVHQRRPH